MTLFDAYVFIDWSSKHGLLRQNPCADGIWVGECASGTNSLPKATYHRSRHGCISAVLASLVDHVKHQRRVLVGFDFPYGYPAGWYRALGLDSGSQAAWLAIWAELSHRIEDGTDNRNNRFAVAHDLNKIAGLGLPGPFWGCPANRATPHLQPTSPGFPFSPASGVNLPRLRIVETRLQGVQEAWKLYGAGSVGSQALVGIAWLNYLRQHGALQHFSQVWPFETGFTASLTTRHGPCLVHAEIWPGVVSHETELLMTADSNLIKDQAQVMVMCSWAYQLDNKSELGALFNRPAGLKNDEVQTCVEQEGWILGAE